MSKVTSVYSPQLRQLSILHSHLLFPVSQRILIYRMVLNLLRRIAVYSLYLKHLSECPVKAFMLTT